MNFLLRIKVAFGTFCISMLLMIFVSSIVWQDYVAKNLFDCTDDGYMSFWFPGDWVHSNHGLIYVSHIVHGRSMGEPDAIKQGWTLTGLWYLWLAFLGGSFLLSAAFAWLISLMARPKESHASRSGET
jgi:hypothetical protein